ncbi:MAG: DUF805 domain-containing protein [Pseudomonadota bacterium]
MDFRALFTDFDGRINRQPFWIGILVLIVASIVGSFILLLFLPAWLAQLIVNLAVIYPALALMVKRLHDHGEAAMPMAAVFILPSLVASLLRLTGLTYYSASIGDITYVAPNFFGWIINLIVLAIGLYALYYLGIKEGQRESNAYGPDPLQR